MFKGQGKKCWRIYSVKNELWTSHYVWWRDQYNKDTKTKAEYFMIAERTRWNPGRTTKTKTKNQKWLTKKLSKSF